MTNTEGEEQGTVLASKDIEEMGAYAKGSESPFTKLALSGLVS